MNTDGHRFTVDLMWLVFLYGEHDQSIHKKYICHHKGHHVINVNDGHDSLKPLAWESLFDAWHYYHGQ